MVVRALRQGLGDDLLSVVVFGSRARREATAAIDWDLLIIARHLPSGPFQRLLQMKS